MIPTTNDEFAIQKVSKSRFLDVDAIESENLNGGGQKTNKHAKAWVKNAFNQWWKFWGYETKKFYCKFV